MKTLAIFLVTLAISVDGFAENRVNSKESLRLCKSALETDTPAGTIYKFKRNSATEVDSDRYKHWINLVEITELEKSSKKLRCETSRVGEVLVLEIKPGRWKL